MSEQQVSLLVDIGNTRTKYSYFHRESREVGQEEQRFSSLSYIYKKEEIAGLLNHCSEIIVSCVNNDAALLAWQEECEKRELPIVHVTTQPEAFGVKCPYQQFSKLGVDRWLCALAVAKATNEAVAIIDIGTAATCDFVVNGEYLGGWIAPGFEVMRRALVENTANVLADNVFPEQIEIGKDTEDCVNAGCLAMLSGFLIEAKRKLNTLSSEYRVIITGGGASLMAKVSPDDIEIEENLVFQGLALFSRYVR